jgi:hypothetical protein
MTHLLTIITVDNKKIDELTNQSDKDKILNLAARLEHLEVEIKKEFGIIDYSKSGNLFVMGFSSELGKKITAITSNG